MRSRLIVLLVVALLLAACGDDGGFTTSTGAGGSTTTGASESTTSLAGSSTTVPADGSSTLPPESSTTTTQPGTTTTGEYPSESVWERVPSEGGLAPSLGRTAMAGVTRDGPGLVGVGWEALMSEADATVWHSYDGREWQRMPGVVSGNEYMLAVASAGPNLVAVGYEANPDEDAAVWVFGGEEWERVPHDEAVFGGPGIEQMFAVTAGGPGWVAVGWATVDGDESAAVWVSADGYTWERITDPAVFGGPGAQAMYGVTAGGPGLVAVGSDPQGDWDAAVWVSADGYTWSRVPSDPATFGGPNIQQMNAVTVGGPGLVAVGTDFAEVSPNGAAWVSADGITWERVGREAFGGPGGQEVLAVAQGPDYVVAVGRNDAGDGDGAVWESADGYTWVAISDPAFSNVPLHQEMLGVTAGGPGVVVVGLEWTPDGHTQTAAVWLNSPGG